MFTAGVPGTVNRVRLTATFCLNAAMYDNPGVKSNYDQLEMTSYQLFQHIA